MGAFMGSDTSAASGEDGVISTINTTPLVDVLLVLLIIFLITIPVVTASVRLNLPKERAEARQTQPENVVISVDTSGALFWYGAPVANVQALTEKLQKVAQQNPQPQVQIRGDMAATYEGVGRVLRACQKAGITKVAFITQPPSLGG